MRLGCFLCDFVHQTVGFNLKKYLTASIFALLILIQFSYSQPDIEIKSQLQKRYLDCLKLLGNEQYQTAINQLQELIADYPDFTLSYRKIADAYILADDLQGGEAYFRKILTETPQNSYSYYVLSRFDFQRENYEQAIEKLKKCISHNPEFPEAYGNYGGLPEVYQAQEDLAAAKTFFNQLIEKNPQNAFAYYGLGRIHSFENNWDKAMPLLKKSIELKPVQEPAYTALQLIYEAKGDFKLAIENSERYLAAAEKLSDLEGISKALLRLGGMKFYLGDYRDALSDLTVSLAISRRIGSKKSESMALLNVGAIYATLGNYTKALDYFEQALNNVRITGPERTEIRILSNMGLLYKDIENYDQALQYFEKVLRLAQSKAYQYEKGMIFTGIGETHNALGQFEQALENHEKALSIFQEIGDEGYIGYNLTNIADLNYKMDKYQLATEYYRRSLELGEAIQDAQIVWESHSGLGACYQKQNDLQNAIAHYQKAIANFDSIRQNLDIETLTRSFLQDKYEVYPSIIQLFAKNQEVEKAFSYAEKYKAKTLLNILSKGQFLFSEMLPDSVRYKLIDLRNRYNSAHAKLSKELSRKERDKERLLELDQQITQLELEKTNIIESIKAQYSAYYQLTSAEPLSIQQLQDNILTPGQVLIEYVVGPQKTSLFAIARDTLIYHEIPFSREKLSQLLADISAIFRSPDSEESQQIFNAEQADFSVPPAFKLYQAILQPIEPLLEQADELVIVPDDFLFYLPFETLVNDTTEIETRYDFGNAQFLIEKYNISYAPSASLLDPDLIRERQPSKALLAMGNPYFGQPAEASTGIRSSDDSDNAARKFQFLPLPNSENEVKGIASLVGGSGSRIYTDKEASEKLFKQQAADYRIIHIASHFTVNDYDPLYSKVVLAQTKDAEQDGFLQTYEVFDMKLNADLVVLSACNTALGKLSKGEGLIGISRAFLYAGVPGMVVSLWSVDDEATSIIMSNFYGHLKEGLCKNEALRLAKIDYLNESTSIKKDPFYWAPFILIGNWQPVPLESGFNYTLLAGIAIGILLIFVIVIPYLRKRKSG